MKDPQAFLNGTILVMDIAVKIGWMGYVWMTVTGKAKWNVVTSAAAGGAIMGLLAWCLIKLMSL